MPGDFRPALLIVGQEGIVSEEFRALAACEFDLLRAETDEEAVAVCTAENRRLAAIIADVLMPHYRGDSLVEWFLAVFPTLPVVVSTARPEHLSLDQLLGFDANGVAVISADLDPDILFEGLLRLVQPRLAELAIQPTYFSGGNMTKILVVDDSPIELQLVTRILTDRGYQVVTASDGDEVLPKAMQEKPRLIILDVVMPRQTGYEACRTLKENAATRDIKVIMLTSKSQRSDRFWGVSQGADDYLTKPFEEKDLLDAIARQL